MDANEGAADASQTNHSSHGIPLQTLSNNNVNQNTQNNANQNNGHRRTLSERGRSLFSGSRRLRQSQRYTALSDEGTTTQQERLSRFTALNINTINQQEHPPPQFYLSSPSGEHLRIDDEIQDSPAVDLGAFQAAIGFAGLHFNAEPESDENDTDELDDTPTRRMTRDRLPTLRTNDSLRRTSSESLDMVTLDDGPAYFSPGVRDEDDTQPLTDGGLRPSVLDTTRRRSRSSQLGDNLRKHSRSRSSQLGSNGRSHSQSSHLGDDLHLESGSRLGSHLGDNLHNTRKRSLSNTSGTSAESAIQRTGTILKNMSQRVVNLSNETDEHTIRKSTDSRSIRNSTDSRRPQIDGSEDTTEEREKAPVNPLRGKSLNLFSPDSTIRLRLLEIITHPITEPFILFLIIVQTVILTIDSAKSVYNDPRAVAWGTQWTDYTIFGIFCVYTIEVVIKCIVSGFFFNPVEYSTIDRGRGLRRAMAVKANELFTSQGKTTHKNGGNHTSTHASTHTNIHTSTHTNTHTSTHTSTHTNTHTNTHSGTHHNPLSDPQEPASLLRTFTMPEFTYGDSAHGNPRQAQRMRLAYRAFLRHSFNRLDFIAVVSFWISIALESTGLETRNHMWVFHMMSSLRLLRLLRITNGTSIILRSLKRAAPTLLNVGFLICFFWLLFAIIGVQSFKSSLRRQCQNDLDGTGIFYVNQTGSVAFCGGWLSNDSTPMPWQYADGSNGTDTAKGYICPIGSTCVENISPYYGTVSYDNIINSLELVFVLMSSNTFSDLMYYLTETDYLSAALFTAFGIIIMNLWLINLLIAVITSAFQVIREEDKSSAFMVEEHNEKSEVITQQTRVSSIKRAYDATYWIWIAVIVYGLVTQALRSDTMSASRGNFIDVSERIVSGVLAFEICFRILADWRDFRHHRRNWVDLSLVCITCIIQIPVIRGSGTPYAWLTFFQVVRIYRVVLAIRITRDLILLVLRFVTPVANLILFVFLLTFLVSIFASQLFRGELPQLDPYGNQIEMTFATIYNSFLAMYQIYSSENWTTIMYNVTMFDESYGTAWVGATFFILWFILGFFIVLPMFIAVIQENFDVSEDQKRLQQVRMFLLHKEMGVTSNHSTPSLSSIFKFGRIKQQDPLDYGSAASEMLLKDAVVRDFLDEQLGPEGPKKTKHGNPVMDFHKMRSNKVTHFWDRLTRRIFSGEPNPFYASLKLTRPYEELDPRTLAQEVMEATNQRKTAQRAYLQRYPNYNTSLYIFRADNPLRKFCQRIVGPGRGPKRIDGVEPNPKIWYAFSAFIYLAIVAMVLLACITTPLFQKQYFQTHSFKVQNWFVFTDIGFATLFTIEAVIKIIADGLFFTPNAYFRSSWGFIDGLVLVTLWANVLAYLRDPGNGSRTIGAFKALRALRLLNISDSARDTFHSVIILGGWKIASAAFVSLSLLIPFAIYATNLFAGTMQSCNDNQPLEPPGASNIANLTDCTGEYFASPYNWNMLAPRQAANSYYDFDSFGDSLFVLFQIVSQEGWIDVQWSAQSVSGVFTQPSAYSRQGNALFFVIFNLVATVFVLTLFVSVFMRTYTEQTGVAFLTAEQRSWVEFSKLLRQVAPSKRPSSTKSMSKFQQWCYRRAIRKSGAWQRSITAILLVHLILLCMEYYPEPDWWKTTRGTILFCFTLIYIANTIIRMVGLSLTRFRKSAWDVYSVLSVSATFITSIAAFVSPGRMMVQANNLCLDSIVLLLIPRNNHLDQLFKTAAASLSVIFNLLATWFVLFLVYAIALTQTFGLTRFGDIETNNINVRTVPKALILLFRCSMGEGWNQIMEDYARIRAPYCVVGETYLDGDCGSAGWARALFVSWNILSMYIFVNLFIALIYESFSYVYQRSTGLSLISREEIRRFKQAWAEHDPNGSGYITKEEFPKFLNELSGVFEMRIYDGDFTIRSLIEDCQKSRRQSALPISDTRKEIDLDLLNKRLAELPVDEIRRRRIRMNNFYEEVLVSADPDRGISFNTLLMILAHYKVINDNKSLKLEEFLRRRKRLQRVEEAVNRNIVVGFFDTLYWSRQFKKYKERKTNARMTELPQFALPEILVNDEDEETQEKVQPTRKRPDVPSLSITPVANMDLPSLSVTPVANMDLPSFSITPVDNDPDDTADVLNAGRSRSATLQTASSGSPAESPNLMPRHRPSPSASSQTSIQPDWHFAAALENASTRLSPPNSPGLSPVGNAGRSRANSAVSQHEMLDMFESSAWGESMRRSATQRRGSSTKRSPQR